MKFFVNYKVKYKWNSIVKTYKKCFNYVNVKTKFNTEISLDTFLQNFEFYFIEKFTFKA